VVINHELLYIGFHAISELPGEKQTKDLQRSNAACVENETILKFDEFQ